MLTPRWRKGVWLGKACVGNVLSGVQGRTRDENIHRSLPQCLRPFWHVGWRAGKAPAAICRKVIEAKDSGKHEIVMWGDGTATRSFMYIDDCVQSIDIIMHCDDLIATPINLGSSDLCSINDLVGLVEEVASITLERRYDLQAPRGVAGRNRDNTMIKRILNWEPSAALRKGLKTTYAWIEQQHAARKAGSCTPN